MIKIILVVLYVVIGVYCFVTIMKDDVRGTEDSMITRLRRRDRLLYDLYISLLILVICIFWPVLILFMIVGEE